MARSSILAVLAALCLLLSACQRSTESESQDGPGGLEAGAASGVEDPDVQAALRDLANGDRETRSRAAERLCHLGQLDPRVIPVLGSLLAAPDPRTRESAAYALG